MSANSYTPEQYDRQPNARLADSSTTNGKNDNNNKEHIVEKQKDDDQAPLPFSVQRALDWMDLGDAASQAQLVQRYTHSTTFDEASDNQVDTRHVLDKAFVHLAMYDKCRPAVDHDYLGLQGRRFLSVSRLAPRTVFHDVVETYVHLVFTPIAKLVGVASQAALFIALQMGLGEIVRVAMNTERPFFGYSRSDFPYGNGQANPPNNAYPHLHEVLTLTTVLYELSPYCTPAYTTEELRKGHIYRRDAAFIYRSWCMITENPPVVMADYRRVAHEYFARRCAGGRAVARRININENLWMFLERILFNKRYLQLYLSNHTAIREVWRPVPAMSHTHMRHTLRWCKAYQESGTVFKRRFWGNIHRLLYHPPESPLFPVLKRYAASPPPNRDDWENNDDGQNLEYQARMVDWIAETCVE